VGVLVPPEKLWVGTVRGSGMFPSKLFAIHHSTFVFVIENPTAINKPQNTHEKSNALIQIFFSSEI